MFNKDFEFGAAFNFSLENQNTSGLDFNQNFNLENLSEQPQVSPEKPPPKKVSPKKASPKKESPKKESPKKPNFRPKFKPIHPITKPQHEPNKGGAFKLRRPTNLKRPLLDNSPQVSKKPKIELKTPAPAKSSKKEFLSEKPKPIKEAVETCGKFKDFEQEKKHLEELKKTIESLGSLEFPIENQVEDFLSVKEDFMRLQLDLLKLRAETLSITNMILIVDN